ncbi:hypothetical protein H4R33_006937, partial [Dimargaris cristalligena]
SYAQLHVYFSVTNTGQVGNDPLELIQPFIEAFIKPTLVEKIILPQLAASAQPSKNAQSTKARVMPPPSSYQPYGPPVSRAQPSYSNGNYRRPWEQSSLPFRVFQTSLNDLASGRTTSKWPARTVTLAQLDPSVLQAFLPLIYYARQPESTPWLVSLVRYLRSAKFLQWVALQQSEWLAASFINPSEDSRVAAIVHEVTPADLVDALAKSVTESVVLALVDNGQPDNLNQLIQGSGMSGSRNTLPSTDTSLSDQHQQVLRHLAYMASYELHANLVTTTSALGMTTRQVLFDCAIENGWFQASAAVRPPIPPNTPVANCSLKLPNDMAVFLSSSGQTALRYYLPTLASNSNTLRTLHPPQ